MAIEIVGWGKHYENYRTRELKALAWIPLPNKHDGDGYTQLLDHPNGAAHFGAWCALVQLASRCHNGDTSVVSTEKHRHSAKYDPSEHPFGRGILIRENGEGHDEASLERITRIPISIWKEVLPRLLSIGWIRNYETTDKVPIEYRSTTDAVPLNGIELNGREGNGIEKKVSTPSAPTRSTVSVPKVDFDFSTGLFSGISDKKVDAWSDAYPALAVETELAKAAAWLQANPAKRKKNYMRFVVNWLARAQERGGDRTQGAKTWKR
jgi:hypothetical protein